MTKKISLTAHCNDSFAFIAYLDNEVVNDHMGHIPDTIPNEYGDDLTLALVLNEDTGKVEVENMTREMFLANLAPSSSCDTDDDYDDDTDRYMPHYDDDDDDDAEYDNDRN